MSKNKKFENMTNQTKTGKWGFLLKLSWTRSHEIFYNSPNPLACVMALSNLSFNFPLLEYSGNRRTLKQVWAVGSLQEQQNKTVKML